VKIGKLFMCNQTIGLSRHIFFDRWFLFDPINVPLSTFSPALQMFCDSSRNFSSPKTTKTKQLQNNFSQDMWATCEKPLVCLRGSCVKADGRWWDAHGISAARMGPELLSAALQEAVGVVTQIC